jgi:hypothetical protein
LLYVEIHENRAYIEMNNALDSSLVAKLSHVNIKINIDYRKITDEA